MRVSASVGRTALLKRKEFQVGGDFATITFVFSVNQLEAFHEAVRLARRLVRGISSALMGLRLERI
jgi:hypothetical protein